MKKFWKVSDEVSSNGKELYIDGVISDESWWGDEATPQQLRDELQQFKGQPLTVVLNSVGGDVFAGLAMYNALRELDSEVTIRVDGLAASIASVIAMSGDHIIMSPGSMMMVHRPSTIAWGNVDEMQKTIELLETIEESIYPIYADRTGLSLEEVTELVNAETWMSAERAVELGFADSLAKSVKKSGEAPEDKVRNASNFAFSMKATVASIEKSAEDLNKKVVAEEDAPAEPVVPAPADPEPPVVPEPPKEEPVLPQPEKANDEDVTDPVEGEPKQQVKKEPTNMTEAEKKAKLEAEAAAAASAAGTPGAEGIQAKAPKQESAAPTSGYLATRQSVEDFAKVLVDNAGKTSQEVKDAWGAHLATMGVTNPEILLPSALITEIEDAFAEGGTIWNLVRKTGLTVFRAAWDSQTGEPSRAKGYNRDEEEEKAEELITIADRVIRAQFIYKYITLNKEDIKENRDTGALVRYVLSELPRRIVREVERAIVIGDGRVDGSDYKIDSFLSLKDDAAGAGTFAVEYTPGVGESKYESLVRARDLVKAEGAKYLVTKTGYLTDILLMQSVNGGFVFAPGTDIPRALGFAGSVEPDWFDDTTDPENDAYIFVPSAYTTVGDNTIEAYTNFILKQNKQEYLQEIYAGGALSKLRAAVAIGAGSDS